MLVNDDGVCRARNGVLFLEKEFPAGSSEGRSWFLELDSRFALCADSSSQLIFDSRWTEIINACSCDADWKHLPPLSSEMLGGTDSGILIANGKSVCFNAVREKEAKK